MMKIKFEDKGLPGVYIVMPMIVVVLATNSLVLAVITGIIGSILNNIKIEHGCNH